MELIKVLIEFEDSEVKHEMYFKYHEEMQLFFGKLDVVSKEEYNYNWEIVNVEEF